MDYIKKLVEERQGTWEAMKSLNAVSENENRSLDAEEQNQWDTMSKELDSLDKRIKELHDLDKRNKEAEARREEILSSEKAVAQVDPDEEERKDNPFKQLANGEIRSHVFGQEKRDLTKSNSAGVVPASFYERMTSVMNDIGVVRNLAFQISTAGGEALKFPVASALSSASIISESSAITEADPTLTSVTLDAYKLAFITQISKELLNDSGVDLEEFMANMAGSQIAKKQDELMCTGTGSSQNNGIATASSVVKTTSAVADFTIDELFDAIYGMGAEYRKDPSFGIIMNANTLNELRQKKDSNNNYLWSPSVSAGNPDTFAGFKVYEDPHVADLGTGNKFAYVGAFNRYALRTVGNVEVSVSSDFAFNTDLISYKFVLRQDSDLLDTSAVKHIANA